MENRTREEDTRTAAGSAYTAGVIHLGDAVDLEACLDSLRAQSLPPDRVIVVDHGEMAAESEHLRAIHQDVDWLVRPNRGYAAGANEVIARSAENRPDGDFVLVLNHDVQLDDDFAESVLRAMRAWPTAAIASGRLLRPGRQEIDSAGIDRARSRRFRDRGSEEPNDERFASNEAVFAVSGAAMMLRRATLPTLSVGGEIFDEDFFMYHEDTDLCWRARNLGHVSLYVADAVAIHGRGWRRGQRDRIHPIFRRHSFKNRYLEMIKNEGLWELLRDLPFVAAMEVTRFGFALFSDRAVLAGYRDAVRLVRKAWRKRGLIRATMAREAANRSDVRSRTVGD